jgi:methylenetetrahydrofolate dehydrogenase (NADP+)/methenyltetrahydrofolate cyclohydrolase
VNLFFFVEKKKKKKKGMEPRFKLLSGSEPSSRVLADLKDRLGRGVALSKLHLGRDCPCLAVIVVGQRSDFAVYTRNKKRVALELGVEMRVMEFAEDIGLEHIRREIYKLNHDKSIDGIIVQVPLPPHLPVELCQEVDPCKDVDGFSYQNVGKLTLSGAIVPLFSPCTPRGIVELLEYHNVSVCGKHVVILGRSSIVGKPLGLMLLQANATVTTCHSFTADVQSLTLLADILVVAVGRKKMVKSSWVKNGAVIVDVGVSCDEHGQIFGDVDQAELEELKRDVSVTPVPGGVGPMTVAMLFKAVVESWERRVMMEEMLKEK